MINQMALLSYIINKFCVVLIMERDFLNLIACMCMWERSQLHDVFSNYTKLLITKRNPNRIKFDFFCTLQDL